MDERGVVEGIQRKGELGNERFLTWRGDEHEQRWPVGTSLDEVQGCHLHIGTVRVSGFQRCFGFHFRRS
jgi:hypothetical protein